VIWLINVYGELTFSLDSILGVVES